MDDAYTIISSDGKPCVLSKRTWMRLPAIRDCIQDLGDEADAIPIPAPKISSQTLEWVEDLTKRIHDLGPIDMTPDDWSRIKTKHETDESIQEHFDAFRFYFNKATHPDGVLLAKTLLELDFAGGGFIYTCLGKFCLEWIRDEDKETIKTMFSNAESS